jgi:hypothetical protein
MLRLKPFPRSFFFDSMAAARGSFFLARPLEGRVCLRIRANKPGLRNLDFEVALGVLIEADDWVALLTGFRCGVGIADLRTGLALLETADPGMGFSGTADFCAETVTGVGRGFGGILFNSNCSF